jgi:hypothetical protein
MTFFSAQKQLISIWFIWTMFLLIFAGYHLLFGIFIPVDSEVMKWFSTYLVSIFTLIIASTFFNKEIFKEELSSKIYYYLALGTSTLYLIFITVVLVVVPRTTQITKQMYLDKLETSGFVLNFMLPILIGVLGYFFYKNKK